METILPTYKDPLFSILIIFFLAFIVAAVSYGWSLYKQQKEEGHLLKFLEKFDTSECVLETENMPFEIHMLKPLSLLAKAFENAGEYQKAINIYLYLIKYIAPTQGELELLERLANTYLHAGFLERALTLYKEILRRSPRNKTVLKELGIVYERMHQFEKAREIIEPLQILGEETKDLEVFLDFSALKYHKTLSIEEKIQSLTKILQHHPILYREAFSLMLQLDTYKAWQLLDVERIDEILDILWFLPNSQLDFDIISNHKTLRTLYYAKGYLEKVHLESGHFNIDILAITRYHGFYEAELHFSYLCSHCKQSFPVSFHRCPNCMSLYTLKMEEHIAKASTQTNYSLL
jgi:tetratricopeptide (TPR) repeat protein